jgi:hypothetical protein
LIIQNNFVHLQHKTINNIMKNKISNEKRIKRLKLNCSLLADGKVKYFHQGNEYVDLGLPSGTKWATMNVGASSETDYGLYFQWGDTQGYTADQVGRGKGKKAFNWNDYKWAKDGGSTFTKYNATDGKTVLDLKDDAVAVAWGGDWHMPTAEQFQELLNTEYCTNIWATINGVNGRLFTSIKNGNKLFIPATGYALNGDIDRISRDSYACIWSSSLNSDYVFDAWYLCFSAIGAHWDYSNFRSYGFSVRGVIG